MTNIIIFLWFITGVVASFIFSKQLKKEKKNSCLVNTDPTFAEGFTLFALVFQGPIAWLMV